jgi:hypothetical protein
MSTSKKLSRLTSCHIGSYKTTDLGERGYHRRTWAVSKYNVADEKSPLGERAQGKSAPTRIVLCFLTIAILGGCIMAA